MAAKARSTKAPTKGAKAKPAPAKGQRPQPNRAKSPPAGKPAGHISRSAPARSAKPTPVAAAKPANSRAGSATNSQGAKPAHSGYCFYLDVDLRFTNEKAASPGKSGPAASKPGGGQPRAREQGASFDAVKDAAIDHLIELIDDCEQQLWRLKQARDFAHYLSLRRGAGNG